MDASKLRNPGKVFPDKSGKEVKLSEVIFNCYLYYANFTQINKATK